MGGQWEEPGEGSENLEDRFFYFYFFDILFSRNLLVSFSLVSSSYRNFTSLFMPKHLIFDLEYFLFFMLSLYWM